MVDRISVAERSRVMSRVRNKHTQPEKLVRRALFGEGFRYQLHRKDLPGQPDLTLPRYCMAIFVHGCFWHGHSCPRGRLPKSNEEFWRKKIRRNVARDEAVRVALEKEGWSVVVLWQCQLEEVLPRLVLELKRLRAASLSGSVASK